MTAFETASRVQEALDGNAAVRAVNEALRQHLDERRRDLNRQRALARVLRRTTTRRRLRSAPDPCAQLFADHVELARSIARRYAGRGEALDDIEQVALFALHQAVRRFDPERGIPFTHFAERTIAGEVKRHFRDTRWAMRVPRSVQEAYLAVRDAMGTLASELGRAPTPAELAEATGRSLEEVVEAIDAGGVFSLPSLDAPVRGEGDAPTRDIPEVDTGFARADARLLLGPLLADLPERDRLVLQLRFEDGLSQSQIGEAIGVSQMQVSRILRRVLAQLRHGIDGV